VDWKGKHNSKCHLHTPENGIGEILPHIQHIDYLHRRTVAVVVDVEIVRNNHHEYYYGEGDTQPHKMVLRSKHQHLDQKIKRLDGNFPPHKPLNQVSLLQLDLEICVVGLFLRYTLSQTISKVDDSLTDDLSSPLDMSENNSDWVDYANGDLGNDLAHDSSDTGVEIDLNI